MHVFNPKRDGGSRKNIIDSQIKGINALIDKASTML